MTTAAGRRCIPQHVSSNTCMISNETLKPTVCCYIENSSNLSTAFLPSMYVSVRIFYSTTYDAVGSRGHRLIYLKIRWHAEISWTLRAGQAIKTKSNRESGALRSSLHAIRGRNKNWKTHQLGLHPPHLILSWHPHTKTLGCAVPGLTSQAASLSTVLLPTDLNVDRR